MEFSAPELPQSLRGAIGTFPDPRTGINSRYTMEDIVLGAFSVFLTQSPSFLAFQRGMQNKQAGIMGRACLLCNHCRLMIRSGGFSILFHQIVSFLSLPRALTS